MAFNHPHHGSPARLLGNVLAAVVIGYLMLHLLAWLGLASPPACQVGRGLSALLGSQLLESLAVICVLAWGLTLFTWHLALLWALVILFGLSWASAQLPALLATC